MLRDLKSFLNSLSEEQLDKIPVFLHEIGVEYATHISMNISKMKYGFDIDDDDREMHSEKDMSPEDFELLQVAVEPGDIIINLS